MKQLFIALCISSTLLSSSCVPPATTTSNGATASSQGNARNWVIIMHGEACGSADDVASNMYVENNHETATIKVVVDISWTANNLPQHENQTFSVAPNSKALIGCDYRNGVYMKMEIVNAQFE
jgi:hypothetical protein